MRLQQPIMGGPRVPYLRNISKTTTRGTKTPAASISISDEEKFSMENLGSIFECPESFWGRQVARHYGHWEETREFILLLATRGIRGCARARASVEALLPRKGGARFDCPVFVKWRPLERGIPFYLCPFCQTPRRARVCRYAEWTRWPVECAFLRAKVQL